MAQEQKSQKEIKPPQTMVTSFEIDIALHSKIKIYAAKNRLKIKDVVNDALKEYIENRYHNDL